MGNSHLPPLSALLLAAILWNIGPGAAAKDELPVDLELVLGVDVSRSIDYEEARLQRQGYVSAFRDPAVIRAIRSGMMRRIAVVYFEWAGAGHTETVKGWALIEDQKSAYAFAKALGETVSSSARRTSISAAIDFAMPMFGQNRFEGTRRVIDISGDGPNNWGDLVNVARDRALATGLTINGLPILDEAGGRFSRFNIPNLDLYYKNCVIGGPGAFFVVAADFKDFARAVRKGLTECLSPLPRASEIH